MKLEVYGVEYSFVRRDFRTHLSRLVLNQEPLVSRKRGPFWELQSRFDMLGLYGHLVTEISWAVEEELIKRWRD